KRLTEPWAMSRQHALHNPELLWAQGDTRMITMSGSSQSASCAPRLLRSLVLPIAILALSACGGGYSDDKGSEQAPAPQMATGQFTETPLVGLGVAVDGLPESQTDADGKFNFAVGRPAQLFIGKGQDRVVIGSVQLAPVSGASAPLTLQDLTEVQNDGDQYLGNLLGLLTALDADGDLANGIVLDG